MSMAGKEPDEETLAFISSCLPSGCGDFLRKTMIFMDILFEESEKHNLTAIRNPADFWIKHICDSLSILLHAPDSLSGKKNIADLGTGAGLPSIPLALALPELSFSPIDSSHKKIEFVRKAALACGAGNINPIEGRGRELSRKSEFKGRFDLIVARAVSTASAIFEESEKMLGKNGAFVLYKTPESCGREICEVRKPGGAAEFEWTLGNEFMLPHDAGRRQFLIGVRGKPQKG